MIKFFTMGLCRYMLLVFAVAALCIDLTFLASAAEVTYDGGNLLIDGVPKVILSGSIHYPRSTVQMWPDLIQKAKAGGLDTIETYVFWDRHEPNRRQYDFSGNLDLVRFLKTIQDAGMNAILRIGPYVCAEWNYGGYPVWLHNLPGIQIRTDNQVYKDEMETFTKLIVDMCKKEKLFAPQGGPIILAQIENEYGNIDKSYGEAGKNYIKWCAQMALNQNAGVPWVMCQQADAPQTMINTCNGFYCDNFKPNNPKSPKMWTENWTGWFKNWDGANPHRTAEDLAFSVARFFQSGGVLQNYYMVIPWRNQLWSYCRGPYITTSYDYDAPLDEYGNLNQPKWGHLKKLHEVLKSAENILTQRSTTEKQLGNGVVLTKYSDKAGNDSICFLSNPNGSNDANVDLQGDGKFFVPAWSVSILTDCKTEVYNTAKINTQTSIMVKKPNGAQNEPDFSKWEWKGEPIKDALGGNGGTSNSTQLLEQKAVTADSSDYLWYMTSVNAGANGDLPVGSMTLRVNTTGHVLHAYVNKKRIGSQWGKDGNYKFVFEQPIKLRKGRNDIILLSATVGLPNYGAFYDLVPAGIVGGPVQLLGTGSVNTTKDLSSNLWSYKIGLNGEKKKFYDGKSKESITGWEDEALPLRRPMTWYKTTFKAPLGRDPVVVDLQGMGKGHAWVNGHSLGRFWPSMPVKGSGCSATCDYRGGYGSDKCLTNCGNTSQRWYHVPRSFLFDDDSNTLILFEEIGGNPIQVNFQTVTVGKACASVEEGNTLELSCQGGRRISAIEFASYGNPQGKCESFKKGTCDAAKSLSVVQKACVGRDSCSINVSEATFGASNCAADVTKKLAVQAVC
ncbi:hypothetical protein IFM89_005461 [Coptis chinensis]|uniref:Beta-galactosidase n=1 Tax=Coptis chinensis TaxID=261450 RepID=A0A835M1L1_9MAGN|nr:hypothetical protein IFM89_005461 [Coptis chinensis]